MYHYFRDNLVNPEMLTLNYPEILKEETMGTFPIDSTYFPLCMVIWIWLVYKILKAK